VETALPQLVGRPKQVNTPGFKLFSISSILPSVDSRASYKSRTIETGNSFLEGLGLEQNTYVDIEKSIYYKNEFGCDRYEQEVYDNDNVTEAEAIRFTESQVWTDMLEGVSQRTGVQVNPAEARLAHKMCKYQLALEPER